MIKRRPYHVVGPLRLNFHDEHVSIITLLLFKLGNFLKDLSSPALDSARKNLTILSFGIISSWFLGIDVLHSSSSGKVELLGISFSDSNNLFYLVAFLLVWWKFRYWQLGFVDQFTNDIGSYLSKNFKQNSDLYTLLTKQPKDSIEFQRLTHLEHSVRFSHVFFFKIQTLIHVQSINDKNSNNCYVTNISLFHFLWTMKFFRQHYLITYISPYILSFSALGVLVFR